MTWVVKSSPSPECQFGTVNEFANEDCKDLSVAQNTMMIDLSQFWCHSVWNGINIVFGSKHPYSCSFPTHSTIRLAPFCLL